ncbi:MAG: hypothetical protein GQ532_17915 [Methylomarinum sp.]|nr:hypothetical protein [Methylomarinum sp.]
MKILQRAKMWWLGTSMEREVTLLVQEKLGISEEIPLEPPFLKRFWLERWTILLPIIVGAAVTLFIHFDTKSDSEAKQKETHKVHAVIHLKTPIN